jgi:hypothetical protein
MAREKITEEFQTKFDKPHFQIGSAVFFSWLGTKKYGYVTAIKKTGWGIQYMVKSTAGTSYPCGLLYKGVTTSYKVGIIYLEETKKLGNDTIAGRIAEEREDLRISKDTRRTTVTSTIQDTGSGTDNDNIDTPITNESGLDNGSLHDVEPSNTRVRKRNTTSRKTPKSTLDEAIEKQKNFLNGFVKKD